MIVAAAAGACMGVFLALLIIVLWARRWIARHRMRVLLGFVQMFSSDHDFLVFRRVDGSEVMVSTRDIASSILVQLAQTRGGTES